MTLKEKEPITYIECFCLTRYFFCAFNAMPNLKKQNYSRDSIVYNFTIRDTKNDVDFTYLHEIHTVLSKRNYLMKSFCVSNERVNKFSRYNRSSKCVI